MFYIVLIKWVRVWYGEIFQEQANFFQEPEEVKIKPESEISSHITLISVISGLFHDIFTDVVCIGVGNPGCEVVNTTL